jgi:hypothetical protein
MTLLLAALVVAGALGWAATAIARELKASREESSRARTLEVLTAFAPGVAAAAADPRSLLVWQPIAAAARKAVPEVFAALDRGAGSTFPFSSEQIRAAHAKWTSDWLTWEQAHDAEYKLKAAAAEAELSASGGAPLARARCEAVEREKLELYQRRYEEYVRISKGLQALLT